MKDYFGINCDHLNQTFIFNVILRWIGSLILFMTHLACQLCWHSGRSNVDAFESRNCLDWQYLQVNSMRNPIRVCGPNLDAWSSWLCLVRQVSDGSIQKVWYLTVRETARPQEKEEVQAQVEKILSLKQTYKYFCCWSWSLLVSECFFCTTKENCLEDLFQWQCSFIEI